MFSRLASNQGSLAGGLSAGTPVRLSQQQHLVGWIASVEDLQGV